MNSAIEAAAVLAKRHAVPALGPERAPPASPARALVSIGGGWVDGKALQYASGELLPEDCLAGLTEGVHYRREGKKLVVGGPRAIRCRTALLSGKTMYEPGSLVPSAAVEGLVEGVHYDHVEE